MKKIFSLFIATMMFAISANAQAVEQSNLFDNLSMTVKGGTTTPLATPIEHFRGIVGLELEKMVTPVFGLGIEGEWTVNTSSWKNYDSDHWFDHQYVGLYGVTNMSNLLAGYKGEPRKFEVETVLGVGWGHAYANDADVNFVMTKTGVNLNFAVNEALTISVKPSVVWNMNAGVNSNYNINRAALQLQAGLTYNFEGPSGNRYFTYCNKVATQAEVDELNRQINAMREENARDRENYSKQVNDLLEVNKALGDALKKCEEREVVVNEVIVTPIQFKQGSFDLATSKSAIKTLAETIKNDGGRYKVIGYASEEGSIEFNQELSFDRAVAVADMLVEYGVNPSQLSTEGRGETTEFGENEMNRIVVIEK